MVPLESVQPSESSVASSRPAPASTFMLAADCHGRQIISCHVKRSYRLGDDGVCSPAEGDLPLMFGPSSIDDESAFPETDVVPFKERTDLIVLTKAWGHGAACTQATIGVPSYAVPYLVMGRRRVLYSGQGSWRFSNPEPFESIEMRYENAYGGFDPTAPCPQVVHLNDILEIDPGEYPRNSVGKGYVVRESRERMDGLELPNIELPQQALTPERLLVGAPENWWRQPLPWSCDWFPKLWYPRIVHYRGVPRGLPDDDRQVEEVRRGWLDVGHARRVASMTFEDSVDNRCADAASPALVLPLLQDVVPVELTGLTYSGRTVVRIPNHRPRIQVRFDGRLAEVPVTVHRILISTLERGAYVVWHGAWLPPRPLPLRPPQTEHTMADLVDGVEVWVDGQQVAPIDSDHSR